MADLGAIEIPIVVKDNQLKAAVNSTNRLERELTRLAKASNLNSVSQERYRQTLVKVGRELKSVTQLTGTQAYGAVVKYTNAKKKQIAALEQEEKATRRAAAEDKKVVAEKRRVERATLENVTALNRMRSSYDGNFAVEQRTLELKRRLRQEIANGTMTVRQAGAELLKYRAHMQQFNLAARDTTQAHKGMGVVVQQAGYQMGDFLVQIQSGQSVFIAFSQQATQMAGFLPLMAKRLGMTTMAAIGLSTALGIAIPLISVGAMMLYNFFSGAEKAKTAAEAITAFSESVSNASTSAKEAKTSVSELAKEYGNLAARAKEALEAQAAQTQAQALADLSKVQREVTQDLVVGFRFTEARLSNLEKQFGLTTAQAISLSDAARKLRDAEGPTEVANAARDLREALLEAGVSLTNELIPLLNQAEQDALDLATSAPSSSWMDSAIRGVDDLISKLGIGRQAAADLKIAAAGDAATALPMTMAPSDPTGFAKNGLGFISPSNFMYTPPSVGSNNSSGGGSAPSDPLADLMKKIELEKELIGTSEAYKEVLQAIQGSDKEYSDAAIQGAVARVEAINQEKAALEEIQSLQQGVADTIGDGLMSMVDGTMSVKDAFRSMARDIIKQLYEVLVVQRLVGSAQGGTGIAGLLGGLFADGGAFSAGKQIQAYANGGVVGGPTYFPMAGGKTGLMGEAGPEAIMPLKRGKDGKLGVTVGGGNSGSVVVNNTINVSGGSDPAAIRAEVAKLMPQITSATKSAVIDARRRGGQMKAAFN